MCGASSQPEKTRKGNMMIENKDKTPVGQIIITMCTKCKLELNHVVVFHNAEAIVERVKCNTCGSEHKYRPDKKESTENTGKKALKGRKKKKVDPAKDFEMLTEKSKDKESKQYIMSGSFDVDDVIEHETFGLGFVISASYLKMEVVFSDKSRLLACNR